MLRSHDWRDDAGLSVRHFLTYLLSRLVSQCFTHALEMIIPVTSHLNLYRKETVNKSKVECMGIFITVKTVKHHRREESVKFGILIKTQELTYNL